MELPHISDHLYGLDHLQSTSSIPYNKGILVLASFSRLKDIMPSFEAITPIPASMDMEIVRGFRLGLVRKEEAFDGRKVGVSSEEDKVGFWREDGKERDAIVIAIVGSYTEKKRRERINKHVSTKNRFFFSQIKTRFFSYYVFLIFF